MKLRTIKLLILLLLCGDVFSQDESIKFYGVTIHSQDVFGKKKPFSLAERKGAIKTTTIESAPVATELYEYLGAVYTIKNFSGIPSQLLNLSLDDYTPILDSIDFKYYKVFGFKQVKADLQNRPEFEKFVDQFKNAANNKARKDLVMNLSPELRKGLEESKYQTINKPITYTQARTINRAFSLGVGTKIAAQIKQIAGINAKIAVALRDTVTKIMKVNDAKYFEIALRENYVTTASDILKKWEKKTDELSKSDDIYFAGALKDFLEQCDVAVITQAAVIEASFDRSKTKEIETAIKAILEGKVDPNKISSEKIAELSAEIGGKYGKNRDDDKGISTDKAFYYIKYCANNALELGACAGQTSGY
jgi:hypothetical protein